MLQALLAGAAQSGIKWARIPHTASRDNMLKWLLFAFVIGIVLVLWRSAAYAKGNLPEAGAAAPGFSLPDQDGRMRSLADFRGKWLALYFFPRADTPG